MNDIDIDPARLRAFANDVAGELDNEFRGRIAEIRSLMGDKHYTLGTGGDAGEQCLASDYSGYIVGIAMGSSIVDGLSWLDSIESGLEALSLASAVFEEELVAGDVLNSEDIAGSAETPSAGEERPRGGGGGKDEYTV